MPCVPQTAPGRTPSPILYFPQVSVHSAGQCQMNKQAALKATIILTFPKCTPVMLVQG